MYRFVIAVVLASPAVQIASADAVNILATDTWSATSSGGNGNAAASTLTDMNFDLSQIPLGSTITSATLTFLDATTSWNIGGFDNGAPPVPPLTFIGEASGSSDILGAEYLDTFGVSVSAPGSGQGGPGPGDPPLNVGLTLDPSVIPSDGTYSVGINGYGSMIFTDFDFPGVTGTPPTPSFTLNGTVDGELEVEFSPAAPEPSSLVLGAIPLIAMFWLPLLRRRRATARVI